MTAARVAGWSAAAIALVAGWGYALAGRPLVSRPTPLPAAVRVEIGPRGGPVARVDDEAWRDACRRAGLPDPPALDGGDPIPVRGVVDACTTWGASHDPAALARLGWIYEALEAHAAALQCFAAMVRLEPAEAQWAYHVGIEAQALGLSEVAIRWLEEAADRDPDYPTTWARLAALYLDRGDLAAADARYARYVRLCPDRSLGYVGQGRVALESGDLSRAEALLEEAVRLSPGDAPAHRMLARALWAAHRDGEAQRHAAIADHLPVYRGWLSFDPRLAAAHQLARTQRHLEAANDLAARRGDHKAQIEILRELLQRRPDDVTALAGLASVYRQAGRLSDARATVAQGLQRYPHSAPLLCAAAEIDFTAGAYEQAKRHLEQALEADARSARACDLLGRTLFTQGLHDQGIAMMHRAVSLDPTAVKVRLALAEMLRQEGLTGEARMVLADLLADDPGNAAAQQMLQRLGPG